MAVNKQQIAVQVLGSEVKSFAADADFTTDAILWAGLEGFTLNVFFPILNGSSPNPKLEIQVSNSDDITTFVTYEDFSNFPLPDLFTKSEVQPEFIRFVYDSTGVDALSTITFEFQKTIIN